MPAKKKSAAKAGIALSASHLPIEWEFPIVLFGDGAIDELIPDDAVVRLSTKDPALHSLGDGKDTYVKQLAGGVWIQNRMMQAAAKAWHHWDRELRTWRLARWREDIKTGSRQALPVEPLTEDGFNNLLEFHPYAPYKEPGHVPRMPNDKISVHCLTPAPDVKSRTDGQHVHQWRLQRLPKSSPVDTKDKVFRGVSITPAYGQKLRDFDSFFKLKNSGTYMKKASLKILSDYDLDIRYQKEWSRTGPGASPWVKHFRKNTDTGLPCRIILLGSSLFGSGKRTGLSGTGAGGDEGKEHLWDFLKNADDALRRQTIIIIGMDMLRMSGADLAYDQSWDRILEDFNREKSESEILRELCKFEHLIVRIGVTGAIYHHNPTVRTTPRGNTLERTLLVYNPDAPRIWFRAPDAQGNIHGIRSAYAACIAVRLAKGWGGHCARHHRDAILEGRDPKSAAGKIEAHRAQQILMRGIKDAICLTQELYARGFGDDAAEVEKFTQQDYYERIYHRAVLCGGVDDLGALRRENEHAFTFVTERGVPQRTQCIAHVHAPIDDTTLEWGIMRNMLRMGIPEHLEQDRARRMVKDEKHVPLLLDAERKTIEKQISQYADIRRLWLAMHIVREGHSSIFNRNDRHYAYQKLLEQLPEQLGLNYAGNNQAKYKWQLYIRQRNGDLEQRIRKSLPKNVNGWSRIANWQKILQPPKPPRHLPKALKLTKFYFLPVDGHWVDEWDLPHYVALELWAQRSRIRQAAEAAGGQPGEQDYDTPVIHLLSNFLRLLMWNYPSQSPVADFGNLKALDQHNVETFANIRNLIMNHIRQDSKKPLNISVFGGPGSGKSFGVKEIANELGESKMKVVEFNMAHFQGKADLDTAFLKVSSILAQKVIPLVFFDEFDCPGPGGVGDYQWLSHFLQPMQDGTYEHDGGTLNLGNSIFVFAGGRHASYQEFQARVLDPQDAQETKEVKQRKFPDFISRIRGYMNVGGLNSRSMEAKYSADERGTPYIIRAMNLRSMLERFGWCEADSKGKKKRALIDPSVAEAFLTVSRYHHGNRSMESLLNMCVRIKQAIVKASFPTNHQLDMHTLGTEFRERMQLPGSAWLTPQLYIPSIDLPTPDDGSRPSWHPVTDWGLLRSCAGLNIVAGEVEELIRVFWERTVNELSRVRVCRLPILDAGIEHDRLLREAMAGDATGPVDTAARPGPWRRPWEPALAPGSDPHRNFAEKFKSLGPEVGKEMLFNREWSSTAAVAPAHPGDYKLLNMLMLEEVYPVWLRLHRFGDNMYWLESDSTRLDLEPFSLGGSGVEPKALWTEQWAWSKKDKTRILTHIVQQLFTSVYGPKRWVEYEAQKRAEWEAIKAEKARRGVEEALKAEFGIPPRSERDRHSVALE